jgi:hypothetical protein
MQLSSMEIMETAGLNSDGLAGFERQIASGNSRNPVLPPDHLRESRLVSFERGAMIARNWMEDRAATGRVRRKVRQVERSSGNLMTVFRASTLADLRAEHLETLQEVVDMLRDAGSIPEAGDALSAVPPP